MYQPKGTNAATQLDSSTAKIEGISVQWHKNVILFTDFFIIKL